MADKYIVGLGEVLLDYFPNKNNEYTDENKKLGGAPAIFAYHADQSKYGGLRGIIVSAIGKDEDGEKIRDRIKKHNMEIPYLPEVEDLSSGTVKVDNTDPNNPQYNIDTEAAWSAIPYNDDLKEIAKNTRAVYFGTLASHCGEVSKKTIDTFLEDVPDDCLKIYDVNLRYNPENNQYTKELFTKDLIEEYIGKCNILKVNLDELDYLCGIYGISGGERKKCRELMKKYPHIKLLIVTMGVDGSSVYWHEREDIAFSSLGIPAKEVKNTVGAGDALVGAFIGELLRRGIPLHEDKQSNLIKLLLNDNSKEDSSLGKFLSSIHHTAVRRSAIVCESTEGSMPPVTQKDLFISYSHKDSYIVDYFNSIFTENNLTFWIDEKGLRLGDDFDIMIQHAIRNCDIFIYFSSKNANESDYVKREILFAKQNDKTIIPIKLDNEEFSDAVKVILGHLNHLNYDVEPLISSIIKERGQE